MNNQKIKIKKMLSRRIDKFGVSSHIFAIIMRVWRITAACACGLPVHTFTCHQHRTTRSLWDDRNVVHIRYCLVVRVDRFALAFRSLPSIPYIYIHFICLNEDNKENEAHRRMTHRKHFSQSFWRGLRKQSAVSLYFSLIRIFIAMRSTFSYVWGVGNANRFPCRGCVVCCVHGGGER